MLQPGQREENNQFNQKTVEQIPQIDRRLKKNNNDNNK